MHSSRVARQRGLSLWIAIIGVPASNGNRAWDITFERAIGTCCCLRTSIYASLVNELGQLNLALGMTSTLGIGCYGFTKASTSEAIATR